MKICEVPYMFHTLLVRAVYRMGPYRYGCDR